MFYLVCLQHLILFLLGDQGNTTTITATTTTNVNQRAAANALINQTVTTRKTRNCPTFLTGIFVDGVLFDGVFGNKIRYAAGNI